MLNLLLKLFTGPIVNNVFDVVKRYQDKQINDAVLKQELEKTVLETIQDVSKSQADVIKHEMSSDSWLARNWRPLTALSFTFIVFLYSVIVPVTVNWFELPPLRIGDTLLLKVIDLLTVCLGGYIAGRSLEKVVDRIFRR